MPKTEDPYDYEDKLQYLYPEPPWWVYLLILSMFAVLATFMPSYLQKPSTHAEALRGDIPMKLISIQRSDVYADDGSTVIAERLVVKLEMAPQEAEALFRRLK